MATVRLTRPPTGLRPTTTSSGGLAPTARHAQRAPPTKGEAPDATRTTLGAIDGHLLAASSIPKDDGPKGTEPMLGPAQERRARSVFSSAAPHVRLALESLLVSLDGAGAHVARALLLRAVAARAQALTSSTPGAALEVVAGFCHAMRGLSSQALRARATVLDLRATSTGGHAGSAAHADPQTLWRTRGTVADVRGEGRVDDNHGLYQRFTGSCGPTALQMMLAENDPVLAFAIHDAGLTSDSTTDATARFQRVLLEQYGGGKSLGRVEAYLRARIHNAVGRLVHDGLLSESARGALDAYLFSGAPADTEARGALEAVRARWGFPDDAEVERLRARRWPTADVGMGTEAFVSMVNGRCAATVGVEYVARVFARGHAWRHIDDVARALKGGVDVPFGCSDPGHWMLLSAVKGRKPHRQFLVSDPDGGRTVWVPERTLTRGTFLDDVLHLSKPGQVPYVDAFLLPSAPGRRP